MNAQQTFPMNSSTRARKTSVQPFDQFLTKKNIPSPGPRNPRLWKRNRPELKIFLFHFSYSVQACPILVQIKIFCSKNPHKRTSALGVQADFILIYRVFSAKLAWKCS